MRGSIKCRAQPRQHRRYAAKQLFVNYADLCEVGNLSRPTEVAPALAANSPEDRAQQNVGIELFRMRLDAAQKLVAVKALAPIEKPPFARCTGTRTPSTSAKSGVDSAVTFTCS